jgi:hypothetical protein
MKWNVIVAASAMAITCAATPAGAAPPKAAVSERSADLLQPKYLKKPAARVATPLVLSPSLVPAAALLPEDVGDADSFGRNVTYLGLAQTLAVTLADDCSASDPTLERCIVNNPAPAPTSFDEADLAVMNLPAKATKSLICFGFTPFISVFWENSTAFPQTARFTASGVINIENEVLDDPALIDPGTGLPFGGVLQLGLSTWHNSHTIQPGETEDERSSQTRSCIAGIVSKRSLVENFGLTDAQATQFFKKPMTIRFGARGSAQMSILTSYFYGIRLYGD